MMAVSVPSQLLYQGREIRSDWRLAQPQVAQLKVRYPLEGKDRL